MSNLQTLLEQRAVLDKQIENTRKNERTEAITKIKNLMSEYDLSLQDITGKGGSKLSSKAGSKVPAKFAHPQTGETWSGRGLQPKWLKSAISSGKKLQDFSLTS
jgi:DNA-binding protein H-NS